MPEFYEHIQILYEVGKKKRFKLLWLPVLARIEVVRSMDIHEIIKLSLCSRKMEGIVRYSKVNVNNIEIHVNIKNSILKIESLNKAVYLCSPDRLKKKSSNLDRLIFSPWIDKKRTSFKNCVSIFKHLQNMISFKSLCLHVNFDGMTVEFFKKILTEPALKDFEFLCLDKGKIDAECLDLAMETAHSNRDLHIKGTKVPKDYYHENAFKFYDTSYLEAEWVRIEHLYFSKNSYAVSLHRHNLTYSNVNTYIKVWIDNDHDMVRLLTLHMRTFPTDILFDGIVVLQRQLRGFTFFLVASNPTKQRKHKILCVIWYNNTIYLFSNDVPIQFVGEEVVEAWDHEYKVLMILNKKKELEEELEKIQNSLETNQDESMVEKKNEISRGLQIVSDELDDYNLVFRNGVYSFM